jgi:hypothetical protein
LSCGCVEIESVALPGAARPAVRKPTSRDHHHRRKEHFRGIEDAFLGNGHCFGGPAS